MNWCGTHIFLFSTDMGQITNTADVRVLPRGKTGRGVPDEDGVTMKAGREAKQNKTKKRAPPSKKTTIHIDYTTQLSMKSYHIHTYNTTGP